MTIADWARRAAGSGRPPTFAMPTPREFSKCVLSRSAYAAPWLRARSISFAERLAVGLASAAIRRNVRTLRSGSMP